jgi:hypothetical protein
MALPNQLTQLPGVFHRPRPAHVLVAAEHDQGGEAVLHDLVGVAQAEVDRVLGGEEGNDALARHVGPEVGHQVAQVVLFLRAHGAVGHHHLHVAPDETTDGVVGVDPGVDAGRRLQFRSRRAQFHGDHVRRGSQRREDDERSTAPVYPPLSSCSAERIVRLDTAAAGRAGSREPEPPGTLVPARRLCIATCRG